MFKIGNVTIENPIVIAPLAGVSNIAFRKIAKQFGVSKATVADLIKRRTWKNV